MKRIFLPLAMLLMAAMANLSACTFGAPLSSPGSVAASTTLDEKAMAGAEIAYQTVVGLAKAAVAAGVLDKAKAKTLDNQCYTALQGARAAYAAGNATNYNAAITSAMSAIADFSAATK